MTAGRTLLGFVFGLVAAGGGMPYEWHLPPGFPTPLVPPDNPMSVPKVELGRRLFYDSRLSANGSQSCSSCHLQALAFSDGRAQAVGSTGQVHRRNAPSLTNVAYSAALTWADPGQRRLETQALVPMLGESPVELGLGGKTAEVVARLGADGGYARAFREAFPGEVDPVTLANVIRALASFERTLVSGDSPYDRLVYQGKMDALSDSAWRGMRLFFSEPLACSRCHAGINFSGPIAYESQEEAAEPAFFDTGLRDPDDTGLEEVTHRRRDAGRFRVPTLRNVALTAPYMHDGSLRTLEEVVDRYASGDPAPRDPRTRRLVAGFRISPEEKRDLIEFLRSLTDETFVTDPRHGKPVAPLPSDQ